MLASKNYFMDFSLSLIMHRRLKTNMAKVGAVVTLYNTVVSGYSQCHSTGNKKKASGGW